MTRSELLHAAEVCVCGQREEDYGTPEDSFRVIGELWETYIKEKCVGDPAAEVCIVPEDVAALLALLKIARIATGHGKSDNWVDLAGYAACGKRVCSSEEHWGCPYGNEGMTDCAVLLEAAYEDTIEKLLALKETLEG